jgi:hypothetical protein
VTTPTCPTTVGGIAFSGYKSARQIEKPDLGFHGLHLVVGQWYKGAGYVERMFNASHIIYTG